MKGGYATSQKTISLSPCGESGLKLRGGQRHVQRLRSLPMRGEWIEIACWAARLARPTSLSPCGESGLKFRSHPRTDGGEESLPMRGEWIEICGAAPVPGGRCRLSPCGESGLKWGLFSFLAFRARLSPCGESGLKSMPYLPSSNIIPSLPMRGEWIEIENEGRGAYPKSGLSPCGESGLKFPASR